MRGSGVRAEVSEAIEELKRAFPNSELTVSEDGQGGAHVMVESVAIGARYEPKQSWLGGHIPPQYPYADIYPVFMDAAVRRRDGKAFEAPITAGHNFCGRPAIQISRRNSRIQNSGQTAVAKFLKILDFLEKIQ